MSARCQQPTGALDQIAWPDKVVAAEILVAFVEAPGNREAGDDSTEKVLGFVHAEYRRTDPVQVFFPRFLIQVLQCPLPVLPVKDVILAGHFIGSEQGREGLLAGFRPDSAKAEGEDELAVAGGQVNLSGQRDVSVLRAVVLPHHLKMSRQVLPAIRYADKSHRAFWPRRGTGKGERAEIALGKKHWLPLVVTSPPGIAVSHVGQVRCQKRIEAVVAQTALQRHKSNFLQHYVAQGIGQHFFIDPVPALHTRIGQFIGGDSRLEREVAESTMAFLFGEKRAAVGDNQAEVAGTGLVHAGKIDLIENAMTQGEPDPAVQVQRRAYACFRARSPARCDSGPARRITKIVAIAHRGSSSPSSSLPEDADLCLPSIGNAASRIQSNTCQDIV